MKSAKFRSSAVHIAMTAILVMILSSCSIVHDAITTTGAEDAAGLTQAEVGKLSVKEQFELVEQRTEHLQELLTETQEQVSTDQWTWVVKGAIPKSGNGAPGSVSGSTRENSYYLEAVRAVYQEGASGAQEDIEPMLSYFESKGWEASVGEHTEGHAYLVRAETGDGYRLNYRVQPDGSYSVSVISEMFWGDYTALLAAVADRIPDEAADVDESLPGVYIPFPQWDDPIHAPDLLNPYSGDE
ncbi:hypothetical protein [Salinibacterium sp. M195]|uniref:hypothetical protein n=1 Tax=Salinibacterium sp. M195 TaxID=2583374 RepID=UPI001C637F4E|nr:hypothetical protein [Salinibacterium sp. M195]QYH36038.1 hypothetical protein FFT87_08785 [Salinibacterium sp. M195]